jgi:hypothetical protein
LDGQTDVAAQLDLGYSASAGKAGGHDIQCRFYYTTKAFSDPQACKAALGGGACKP